MALEDVISQIDNEISKLQQARAILAGTPDALKQNRGRPKGSKNTAATATPAPAAPAATSASGKKARRQISPEGRKAIAEAMKKRWAERRKE